MDEQEKLYPPNNLETLKAKIYEEMSKNKKYFITLSEFVFNQIASDSFPPLDAENMDFRSFLNKITQFQLEYFESKIKALLQDFEVSNG